jgi:hypothetical protein
MSLGRTAKFYKSNPEAQKKKAAYDKKYNKKPSSLRKRVELNKKNRQAGTYGNGDGLDWSHTKNGMVKKKASKNRGSTCDQPGDKRARGKKRKNN